MYSDQTYLKSVKSYKSTLGKIAGNENIKRCFLNTLKPYSHYSEMEQQLIDENRINFSSVFHEPLGCYMIKSFMAANYSLCKAIFVLDVELYKKLRAPSGRVKVASLIFKRFILSEQAQNIEESVFNRLENFYNKFESDSKTRQSSVKLVMPKAFFEGEGNCIGYYDKTVIEAVGSRISGKDCPPNLFDTIYQQILNDIRFDIFPRFLKSAFYKRYITLKSVERESVGIKDFSTIGTIGYGAFGFVVSAVKKNTGKVYAIKCLSKKHIIAAELTKDVLNEKKNLSMMDSHFVTCLKFAFADKLFVYFVLDLMPFGDLKELMIAKRTLNEDLARFYAAEILLGLQHIHEKGIIYRDIKLENILIDKDGHVKISDLGLSVCKKKTKGYVGTPGYIAPEILKGEYYDHTSDFFGYGVMIYRFLCGKKPFGDKAADISKNTLNIEPKYPKKYFSPVVTDFIKKLLVKSPKTRMGSGEKGIEEIKQHEWLAPIDFGLLEAGYIPPPSCPDEETRCTRSHTVDTKVRNKRYKKVKITRDFNRQFRDFDYISSTAMQQEVVEVLQKIDKVEGNESGFKSKESTAQCCGVM